MTMTKIRRSFAVFTVIALPFSAIGCGVDTEALLPISAACEGVGVPAAADYDIKTPNPPAVAIHKQDGVLTVNNYYLGPETEQADSIEAAQVVVCVYPGASKTIETCRYIGAKSSVIKREEQEANVKLVAAKTGQPLGARTFSEEAATCPESVSYRQGSEPEDKVYTAETQLNSAIRNWVSGAIASAQPGENTVPASPSEAEGSKASDSNSVESKSSDNSIGTKSAEATPSETKPVAAAKAQTAASGDAGNLEAQCEALNGAMKTEFRYGYAAQLSAQSGLIDPAADKITVRVASKMGLKKMPEHLGNVQQAIATVKGVPLAYPELLELRDSYLGGLNTMEKHITEFQSLSESAEPHAQSNPINREKLEPISQKMAPVSKAITQQSEELQETKRKIFKLCLKLT
ncbi:MAG: hypothetical protein AAF889_13255 [Cyanobacteria bacterium P01_D01_bin.73]